MKLKENYSKNKGLQINNLSMNETKLMEKYEELQEDLLEEFMFEIRCESIDNIVDLY